MEERIKEKLEELKENLADAEERREILVKEFNEFAAKCDASTIVTFIPGKVREIEDIQKEVREIKNQVRMLSGMLRKK